MDEPLGRASDKQLREHMQFEIKAAGARPRQLTVVYVTHDQTEALTMSDRVPAGVFFLQRITARSSSSPRPICSTRRRRTVFVAQFIGENNTLAGIVDEIADGVATVRLDDGEVIDCKPVNVSRPGERTCVSIRPERVEYNKQRLRPGAHTLKAEVLEFIYMGDIYRTRLRVAGNENFIIKTRNAPDQRRLQPGEQIEIGWLPEDCRALDA